MSRVLAVTSEIYPLIKTGGLADVTGALPLALKAAGVETTTLVPGYPAVLQGLKNAGEVWHFPDMFGGHAHVIRGTAASLDLLVLDAPHLFARPGNPYLAADGREWHDNGIRFAALGAAGAAIGNGLIPGLSFDIVHAHDWQSAMAPVYLNYHHGARPGTVLTIHNLAFQGRFAASLFPRLGLPGSAFGFDGLEYHHDVSFLKGGLCFADRLTTVSPTYAREITTEEYGMGLDGLMRYRAAVLTGIVNGIDDAVWNPATDELIPHKFSRGRIGQRAGNKTALQRRLGLTESQSALVIGVVSRLTSQKGLDMLLENLPGLIADGVQVALLGSGDRELEFSFIEAAARNPGAIGCVIGYNEQLAHLIQAGSDALLVPSRFEPCGLTQLCALRYGSIPVVSRVGGLADTIIDANEAALTAGVATGVQFSPATPEALEDALHRLLILWRNQPVWQRMQRNAMSADVSWRNPATHYATLYKSILAARS
nr:glycogen synthase GlgA [uncultured Rhodopila sp.]